MTTSIYRQINNSALDIGNGYRFCWMDGGDEIVGYIEDAEGKVIEETNGWFRTTNPQLAAFRAVNAADLPIIRTT